MGWQSLAPLWSPWKLGFWSSSNISLFCFHWDFGPKAWMWVRKVVLMSKVTGWRAGSGLGALRITDRDWSTAQLTVQEFSRCRARWDPNSTNNTRVDVFNPHFSLSLASLPIHFTASIRKQCTAFISLSSLPWLRRCRESSTTSAPPGSSWWPAPPWSGWSWSPPPSSCPSCRSGSWRWSQNPETLHGINRTLPPPVLFSDLQEKLCQFRSIVGYQRVEYWWVWGKSGRCHGAHTWRLSHTTDTLSFLGQWGWANLPAVSFVSCPPCKWTLQSIEI